MRHNVPGLDRRLGERGTKSRDALRSNRDAIAVVLRDGGEDLERLHARARRAARRHVDAAVVDRVGAEEVSHLPFSVVR